MENGNCWLTYCEPMEGKVPRVSQADIEQAIEWYRENTGELPTLIALNPKNVGFEGSMPDGIELRYIGGVLRGQVWLATSEPVPAARGDFDSRRDNELIAAGTHFFCNAHSAAVPLDGQSPDPRYCQGCYDFLLAEAKNGGYAKRSWIPKKPPNRKKAVTKLVEVPIPTPVMEKVILSQPKKLITVDKKTIRAPIRIRGRKRVVLPEKEILKLAEKGMSSRRIAYELLKKYKIVSNYRTIARITAGQRVLV